MAAFVILGVSGAGKSTIGAAVAAQLQLPFIEADDFHPAANVAKMSAGIPLTDEDRAPWIDGLVKAVNAVGHRDVVIACSALTEFVRRRLRAGIEQPVIFIHLTAPRDVLEQRLTQRRKHFMKAGMLGSQLETLDPPQDAIVVDTNRPLPVVVAQIVEHFRAMSERRNL